MYNSCSGDFGFTWTDTTGWTPSSILVEVNRGINCDSGSASTDTTLNSVASGTFTWTGDYCQCDPTPEVLSWTLTDVSGFNPSGSNPFSIAAVSSCDGLTQNPNWTNSAYAKVTLTY